MTVAELQLVALSLLLVVAAAQNSNTPVRSRLVDAKVLLPYVSPNSEPVTYVMNTQGGCYEWKAKASSIVTVTPLFDSELEREGGCSQSALITPVGKVERAMTVIMAHDKGSNHEIRCDVIIEKIARLEVVTRTKYLYLDDPFEVLTLAAFDEKGNQFSSLSGLVVSWVIKSNTTTTTPTLRSLPFAKSTYTTTEHVFALEAKGLQGDMLLVEGISFGKSVVTATIADNSISHSVDILVLEKLDLQPGEVHLVPGASAQFSVGIVSSNNTISNVAFPNNRYKSHVDDDKIASISNVSSIITGLVVGSTNVQFIDKGLVIDSFMNPSIVVNVVEPRNLRINLRPIKQQQQPTTATANQLEIVLEVGGVYVIDVKLIDANGNNIEQSPELQYSVDINKSIFSSIFSSKNGSFHVVQAINHGDTVVKATFLGAIKNGSSAYYYRSGTTINNEVSITVFDKLTIIPSVVVLPLTNATGAPFTYQLQSTGGSGHIQWSSQGSRVVTVNKGHVAVVAAGATTVTVNDIRNMYHTATAQVFVSQPASVSFLAVSIEAAVDHLLTLPFGIFDSAQRPYVDCRNFGVTFAVSDSDVISISNIDKPQPSSNRSCLSVVIVGHREGSAIVTAKLGSLVASVTVHVTDALTVTSPTQPILITYGSSVDIIFRGGPAAHNSAPEAHFELLEAEKPETVRISHVTDDGVHSYFRVICAAITSQVLTLSVGNKETTTNPRPRIEKVEIAYSCAQPVSVDFWLSLPESNPPVSIITDPCADALLAGKQPHPVLSNRSYLLVTEAFDAQNRRFLNHSSLAWKFPDFLPAGTISLSNVPTNLHSHGLGKSVAVGTATGLFTASTSISGYVTNTALPAAPQLKTISTTFRLKVLHPIQFSRPSLTLIAHSNTSGILQVEHGSGRSVLNVPAHSPFNYTFVNNTFEAVPLAPGQASIEVVDSCFRMDNIARASVLVSDVGSISVSIRNKVQIGRSVVATVCVLDSHGTRLTLDQIDLVDLHVEHHQDTVSFVRKTSSDVESCVQYDVRGLRVGGAIATFSASASDGRVFSAPITLQVFPALEIRPSDVVLVPGAEFQVECVGWPSGDAVVLVFLPADSSVASVSSEGIITAKSVGTTQLTVKAQESGDDDAFVYSSASVKVTVKLLTGIKISNPTSRLVVGAEIDVHVTGYHGETPFTFGSLPIQFAWSSRSIDIASVGSQYHRSKGDSNNDLSARVVAKQAGSTTLSVRATSDISSIAVANAVFEDAVVIEVVDKLEILSNKVLFLPLGAKSTIVTSRDGSSGLSFVVQIGYSARSSSQSEISVSSQGEISTGSTPLIATIYVTDSHKGMNQTAAVFVEVSAVSHVSVTPLNLLWPVASQTEEPSIAPFELPIGLSASFIAKMHDATGRVFDTCDFHSIASRPHRFDVVRINRGVDKQNCTFIISGSNIGQAVVQVSMKSSSLASTVSSTYIRVRVVPGITPSFPLVHIGATVCLHSVLDKVALPELGVWTSSESEVAVFGSVMRNMALVANAGITTIHNHRAHASTFMSLESAAVSAITLQKSQPVTLNDILIPNQPSAVFLQVNFYASGSREFTPLLDCFSTTSYLQQIPFECRLAANSSSFDKYFKMSAFFNTSNALSYCKIEPTQAIISEFHNVSTFHMVIAAWDSRQSYNIEAVHAVDFIPAFKVQTHNLDVSPRSRRAKLEILSLNPSVLAFSSSNAPESTCLLTSTHEKCDLNGVVISIASQPHSHSTIYEVHVKSDQFEGYISIQNVQTKQIERVTITITADAVDDVPAIDVLLDTIRQDVDESSSIFPFLFVMIAAAAAIYAYTTMNTSIRPDTAQLFQPIDAQNTSAFNATAPDAHQRSPPRAFDASARQFLDGTLNETSYIFSRNEDPATSRPNRSFVPIGSRAAQQRTNITRF